mgnify:FL=1
MRAVTLKKHDLKYTEIMSSLIADPRVQNALGLNWQQVSINGTRDFIDFIQGEERIGKQMSRVILNENDEFIGVITIKSIDRANGVAHVGTWLGAEYWGLGYNELAKEQMFTLAFEQLPINRIFAGAKLTNLRSIAAQKKLPYITMDVGHLYPEELEKIEIETKEKCILNVVEKENFLRYLKNKLPSIAT